jgi:RNA polymerase sigma-70 factor, ECF subfamily
MSLAKTDSVELVSRAVAGDTDALSMLLAAHGPAIEARLTFARRWRGALEASDVMQVTYLEAFLEIRKFDSSRADAFPAWLARLAQNNLRDALRGLGRQKRPPAERRLSGNGSDSDDSRDHLLETLATTSWTASRALRREEAHSLLDAAIRSLPEDYGAVIRAYDLQAMSIEAVASTMGRSPGAIHMLRARAHQRLAEILGSIGCA